MKTNLFCAFKKQLNKGFSLVEVTMAVGITALGVISLVGLVPSGLDSLRQSSARVAEAKIIQAVTSDYQMGDWGSRSEGQGLKEKDYYFDEKGLMIEANDDWRHYTVRASVEKVADEADGMTLTGDNTPNRYLYRLVMKITDKVDANAAFADPKGESFKTYGNVVALIEQTDSDIAFQ